MKISFFVLIVILMFSSIVRAELPIGIVPAPIVLKNDNGGRIDGSPWSSEELRGKINILFYIDPQETDLNRHVEHALDKTCLMLGLHIVAVINTAAAWYPDSMILSEIEKRQKWAHNTTFIFDKEKVLVEKWNLMDDSYDVLVFDMDGRVIFSKDGELSAEDINQMLDILVENLSEPINCKNGQLTDSEIDSLIMTIRRTRKVPFGWSSCYREDQ